MPLSRLMRQMTLFQNPVKYRSYCVQTSTSFLCSYRHMTKLKCGSALFNITVAGAIADDPVFPFCYSSHGLSAASESVVLCTVSVSHPPGLRVVTDRSLITTAHRPLSVLSYVLLCSSVSVIDVSVYMTLLSLLFFLLDNSLSNGRFFSRFSLFATIDSCQTPPCCWQDVHDMIFWLFYQLMHLLTVIHESQR